LYDECKTDVATLENGIQANDERLKKLGYQREDTITYNRTKPIYTQYENTKYFKERFRKKHESDIIAHEDAQAGLRYHPRPLPTVKQLDARIAEIKAANVINHRQLKESRAELKHLSSIHSYLFNLRLTHQPPPEPKQPQHQQQTRTKKRSNDLDR